MKVTTGLLNVVCTQILSVAYTRVPSPRSDNYTDPTATSCRITRGDLTEEVRIIGSCIEFRPKLSTVQELADVRHAGENAMHTRESQEPVHKLMPSFETPKQDTLLS